MNAARKSIATNDRHVAGHCGNWLRVMDTDRRRSRLAVQFGNQLRHVIVSG